MAMEKAGAGALGLVLLLGLATPAWSEPPEVVVTIKPLHSLVASVMGDVGAPSLLLKGAASPHSYSLRPSDAKALNRAKLIFWVGEGMETFLVEPLKALSGEARLVEIAELPQIELLDAREGGAWEAHAHGDHDEHDHKDHAEAEHHAEKHEHGDGHGHDETAHADEAKEHEDHAEAEHHAESHEHGDGHEHAEHADEAKQNEDHAGHAGHGEHDKNLHLWLDPHNAEVIVKAAVKALGEADPANAARYQANGAATLAELEMLDGDLRKDLLAVKDTPFVVFHDAYHYFEAHYGLTAVGSISVDEGRTPGAKRLREVREKIVQSGARCVFSEPQFEPALVATVIEGTPARTGVLDPLGAELAEGPAAYGEIMRGLAASLNKCLAPQS